MQLLASFGAEAGLVILVFSERTFLLATANNVNERYDIVLVLLWLCFSLV